MKKFLTILISCILIIFLVGCNGKKNGKYDENDENDKNDKNSKYDKYESLVFDISNDGIITKTDVEYWSGEYFDEKNVLDKTIEFDGVKYKGKYLKSIVDLNMSYTTQEFRTDEGIRFSIRSDTKQLVAFTVMNNKYFETEPYLDDIENSAQVASDIADNIARQYLDDIDSYTLKKTSAVNETERDGKIYTYTNYRFRYIKVINGYETSDGLYISVNSKGHFVAFNADDIGAFDDIEVSFDETKVNDSLDKKISELYEKTGYTVMGKEIKDKKLAKTPDGDVCIVANIKLSLQDKNGYAFDSGVRILVMI